MAVAGRGAVVHETDQLSAEGSSAPSCGSPAWPEKPIMSPTFHVRPGVGVSITAVGGVLPAVMVTEATSVTPWSSVTRSLAV